MQKEIKVVNSIVCLAENAALPDNFIADLPAFFNKSGETIHKARNEIKVYPFGERAINVKKYCIPPIFNRIFYSVGLRTPKARSSYENSLKIIARGFSTPKPLAYIIERGKLLITHSYYISEQVQDMRPIGHGCKDKNIALALADYTARLHEAGLLHRDYSSGNILYRVTDGAYNFMLVDVNRFSFKTKPIGLFAASRALLFPFGDKEMLKIFVSEYARCRGFNEKTCIRTVKFFLCRRKLFEALKRNLKKLPGAKSVTGKAIKNA